MGKQVGFYAVGADHDELLRRIVALGLMALPSSISAEVLAAVPPHAFKLSDRIWHFFYLVPSELDRSCVKYTPMTVPPTRRLAYERSPVIEWLPSKIEDGGAGARRGTPGRELAERRYNNLARWIRRWPRTDQYTYYVGPETAARARAGELRLRYGRVDLHVAEAKP